MITSTVGFAAASTYPAPFSSGATIVYGSVAASSDIAAAISIQNNLNAGSTAVTSGDTGATVTGGDSYQFSTGSNKLYFGKNLSEVKSTLTSDHLPVLLKDGTYRNKKSDTYDYTQQITLAPGLQFTQFSNSDYQDSTPTIGIAVAQDQPVLNYTVSISDALSTVDTQNSNTLTDFKNTKLTILGKEYTIMDAKNNSDGVYLQLMAGAARDTVNLNEEKTFTVGNNSYTVKLTYVDASFAKFTINGETTDSIAKSDTYKLADGSQIGLNDISYQNFAGGIMAADISLGADKLELENGQNVKVNDKANNDLTATIVATSSGTTLDLSKIIIVWKPTDNSHFLTQGSDLVMPALGSVKLTMSNLTVPGTEKTKILADGDDAIKLQTTVKDGDYSLDLLYGNSTGLGFSGLGKSATKHLVTSGTSSLSFDSDTDANFVASWSSGSESESYILKFDSFSSSDNTTSLTNVVTGASKDKLKQGSDINFGNVELTIAGIDAVNHVANVTLVSSGSLDQLYTKKGLMVYLPTTTAGVGYINTTTYPASYNLVMTEQNKDGDVNPASGGHNITVALKWDSTNTGVEVANLTGSFTGESGLVTSSGGLPQTADSSKIYVGYTAIAGGDALGTKVTYDTNPNQATAELEYHGGETYGNVFIASSGAVVTPGSSGGSAGVANVVTDKDVGDGTAYASSNLIVVGGSCINTVALKIISPTATAPVCGQDFTLATKVSPDQYLVETVANPYAATGSGKIAMLVAGYEAADTTNAAAKVLTGVDTTVGTSQVYPIVAATP
jgi:hypothetical protein